MRLKSTFEVNVKSLLLIAHGSRREASNQEVRELAEQLAQVADERFDLVVPAFLELAEPNIQDGVDRCVTAGATSVTAVPYFLSAGRHVAEDIPEELEKARCRHSGVAILQCDYLGRHDSIPGILLKLALNETEAKATPQTTVPRTV